ncbi:MAG: terminase large subunit domain-containing protein [Armatimonadota bacterium]
MKAKTLSPARRIELARRLWSWEPHPTQAQWLLDRHPVKVATCGRRWGKTEAAAVDIATYAIANSGSIQIIVAPTYDQSKLISGTVERLLMSTPMIRSNTRITKTPYPNIQYRGSRIMARTADDDGRSLRGHSADRVIVDEAAYVRDQVIDEVIGPMLADRNGRLVMISTPFGKNHFYKAFTRGAGGDDPRCRSFRFPSWSNPHINREYIEYQRTVLTDRQFKVEYEAEFADDASSVFPWSDIQAAISERSCEPDSRSVYVAGIDWARYSDYTAVAVVEVQGSSYRVVALDRFNRMEWHAQVERAADLLCRYRVKGIAADQTSSGDPAIEILRNALWGERHLDADIEGVVFTNQSKREMIDNLAIRLAHRELTFPNIEQLVRELQFYEYELTESGNVRTNARRGYNDDCVCALALALRIASRYRYSGDFTTSGRIRESAVGW